MPPVVYSSTHLFLPFFWKLFSLLLLFSRINCYEIRSVENDLITLEIWLEQFRGYMKLLLK